MILEPDDVAGWVAGQPALAAWGPVRAVSAIGDGNLNNVFRVRCASGSFVLKQSMPYVRIDPTWPLTPARIDHEALAYAVWDEVAPGLAPRLHLFDRDAHALVVEDLAEHRVWREALAGDEVDIGAAHALGAFLARDTSGDGAWRAEADNPVMTRLMDDVLFRFPYEEHPHNSYAAAVAPLVEEVRSDAAYRDALAELRERWYGRPEALIHGDLHTGSVMVGPGGPRVIDAEFSWYGPVAWDLGELSGNLLVAAIRGHVTGSPRTADLDALNAALWAGHGDDPAERRADAIGYAGVEMVRRVIGSGKADEIAVLPADAHAAATAAMLRAGRELVLRRAELEPAACIDVVRDAL